jgi:hypothetical protein
MEIEIYFPESSFDEFLKKEGILEEIEEKIDRLNKKIHLDETNEKKNSQPQ